MSRSVAVPGEATAIWYIAPDLGHDDEGDLWIEHVTESLLDALPSLWEPSRPEWIGRECRVIARNRLGAFCLSEYCGLWALAFVPEREDQAHPFASAWAAKVYKRVAALFGDTLLRHVATASNGEAFFERATA